MMSAMVRLGGSGKLESVWGADMVGAVPRPADIPILVDGVRGDSVTASVIVAESPRREAV
jgi:hypothetical protein